MKKVIATVSVLIVWAMAAAGAEAQALSGARYQQSPKPACPVSAVSSCVRLVVKPTMQVKNLHPDVKHVRTWCYAKIGEPDVWVTGQAFTLNPSQGDASGSGVAELLILKTALSPGQAVPVTCELHLSTTNHAPSSLADWRLAVASAAQPVAPTPTNWDVVATGSAVSWSQTVTFPSATP